MSEDTHGRVLRPQNRVIAQSQDMGWRSLHAAIISEAPFQATEAAMQHPSIIYHLCHPTEVARKIEGGLISKAVIRPRFLSITPGKQVTQWSHAGHPEILQIYLRQSIYAAAVNELFGCDASQAEILPRFAILDPFLEQLAITIADALRTGTSRDGLYIDMLAQTMAAYLAINHSTRTRPAHVASAKTVPNWKIRRVLDFIEENLEHDLSLEAMAAEINISFLYLPRVFKAAVGQTPHQYVLGRRIERAKELLRNTDLPIADISLSVGFSSQSHLSNWFLRMVGVSPAIYRRQTPE